ncbi:hypothetical protein Ddye_030497 [Dipteronia dyeriana]|uniref:Uncharacterized protein n=1 Tax=Dipteronia dyeriana TaxID=168575 RepID=A0AAD9TGE3_9ROSI|nr:hypothetical protein Ddye_030497 [Dipteronia dyeriana]
MISKTRALIWLEDLFETDKGVVIRKTKCLRSVWVVNNLSFKAIVFSMELNIAVLEEQKKASEIEAAENPDNKAKPADTEANTAEPTHRTGGFDETPDINDVPMEEIQDNGQIVRQDLNESTLDLSLGLKAHDGDSDSKTDQTRDGKLERLNSNG